MLRTLLTALAVSFGLTITACGGDSKKASTSYPAAGDDRFENTHATVQIEITQPGVAAPGAPLLGATLQTIDLDGPALVVRGAPVQDGDVFVVSTEIKEMELRGTSSFGPVIVRESSTRESKGEVRQQKKGEDFPADSFFDVFVEVELPDLNMTVHNEEAMHMVSTLESLPPSKDEKYRGEDDRPLFTPAGIQVGRIVDALHVPEPEPEPEPTVAAATATSTSSPAATSTVAPTATSAAPVGGTTRGSCTHGTGQSVLHILFSGLAPGTRVQGMVVQNPPDGLISPPEFDVTADDNGNARADIDIKKFGAYSWIANDGALRGNYTVAQTCPGL